MGSNRKRKSDKSEETITELTYKLTEITRAHGEHTRLLGITQCHGGHELTRLFAKIDIRACFWP